jgi:hypothetical protein
MNGNAATQPRGRTIFSIFSVVGALVVFLLWLAFGSAQKETIRFTVVNADTGAAVTNVNVTVYRQKHPLLKELSEFTDRPLVHFEERRVNSSGIVETVGPHRERLLSVHFRPDSNFAPVIFTRTPSGDSFSAPGYSGLAAGMAGQGARINRITVALQPTLSSLKP